MAGEREYLYRLLPARAGMVVDGPTPEESAVVRRHFEHLTRLAEENVVLLFGRTDGTGERTFGICVFRAEDATSDFQRAFKKRQP